MSGYRKRPGTREPEFLDNSKNTKWSGPDLFGLLLSYTGLIGFDVGVGSFIVRPELLRLLKQGKHRDAKQDDLALAV